MDGVLALRPFVPAKDFTRSIAFYEAMGFRVAFGDAKVAILEMDAFSFILQNFYQEELASNFMVQLLVRDAGAWWEERKPAELVGRFGVREPLPPTMQHWGLKVGFVFDPSGVLWHIAEAPARG